MDILLLEPASSDLFCAMAKLAEPKSRTARLAGCNAFAQGALSN
jgi:hypothetical protein